MSSLLKKFSISFKIHVVSRCGVCLANLQIVDRIRRQSSWASCECVHTADAMQLDSCVASASAVCIWHKSAKTIYTIFFVIVTIIRIIINIITSYMCFNLYRWHDAWRRSISEHSHKAVCRGRKRLHDHGPRTQTCVFRILRSSVRTCKYAKKTRHKRNAR